MNETLSRGNRQSETRNAGTMPYVYSPPNWLYQKGSETRPRTPNGNTASTSTASFTYDGFNRLATSQTAAETTTYIYNALGERIKKINQNGLSTVFHYGPNGELLYERDASGNTKAYVWLDGRPLARIDNDAQIVYYHVDRLGTPQAMTDTAGATVWKAVYEPFGMVNVTVNTVENNLRFPGQYYDRETGLHYNYFRDYDPTTGRYIEADPIGLNGGLNIYGYANQNPLTFIDPLGLAGASPFGSSSSAGPPLGFPDVSAQAQQQLAKNLQQGVNTFSDWVQSLSQSAQDECEADCNEDKRERDALCFVAKARGGKVAQKFCLTESDRIWTECLEKCKKNGCKK